MEFKLAQINIIKIIAVILIILGIIPFYSIYGWIRPKAAAPQGHFMAIYLVTSVLFVYIGLRLLLKKRDNKRKHSQMIVHI